MSPQDRATFLLDHIINLLPNEYPEGAAIIAKKISLFMCDHLASEYHYDNPSRKYYWPEVKKEIEKI